MLLRFLLLICYVHIHVHGQSRQNPRGPGQLSVCDDEDGIKSCECTRISRTAKPPMSPFFIVHTCKPQTCECNSGVQLPITDFGCIEGGVPGCGPNGTSVFGGDSYEDVVCQDGTEVTKGRIILAARKKKCICPDRKFPVCKDDDEFPKCPGTGVLPDIDLASPDFSNSCSYERNETSTK